MFATSLQQETLSYHQTQYHCSFILTGDQMTRPWHLLFLVRGQQWFQKQEKRKITSRQRKNSGEQNCPTSKRSLKTKERGFSEKGFSDQWRPLIEKLVIYLKVEGILQLKRNGDLPESAAQMCIRPERAVSCLGSSHPPRRSERLPALLLFS